MKKIKYLLLGIVFLLGIGCSFGYNLPFLSLTNSNGTQHLYGNFRTGGNNSVIMQGFKNSFLQGPLIFNTSRTISSYGRNYRRNFYNDSIFGFYLGALGSTSPTVWGFIGGNGPSDYSSTSYFINGDDSENSNFNYLHLFYLSGSNTKYSNYYFVSDTGIFTNSLSIYDVKPGYFRKKIFPLVSSSFSTISIDGVSDYEFSYIPDDGISSDGIYNITGIVLFHFDYYTGNYVSGNNTIILFKDNSNIYYNIFNSYSDSVLDFVDVSPISKGILIYDGNNGKNKFDEMVFDSGLMFEINGNLSDGLYINSVYKEFVPGEFYSTYHYAFNENSLVLHWYDFINGDGGNGNQSFPDPIFDGGVFDANTYLIEESIKCYLTSGEVCNSPFTYENSKNYVNNYDHQERVRNSTDKTGYLTFNNSVDMLSQYCLNVNTIQYAFCSQLYLYEGSPITYYYNNGYFNYIISGSGWQVNLGTLWSGQLGYAYCDGPYCLNFNEGLPQFIRQDTGDYSAYGFSGEYVSLDFFKNYFENGFFFQCPFSYTGSYFTIGSKLIDRLDKHDPLKPINCMIAGFSHGIKSSFFGDSKLGLSHSGVFLQNTGPFATRFYTFIDIVLSLGYIFLFSKLFKFLKKH